MNVPVAEPAIDNPDHVANVIHNYRWPLGLAQGETHYDERERQPALGPVIEVPTITLERDANGAPHPDASAYAGKFGTDRHAGASHPPAAAAESHASAELGRNPTRKCMHT